MRDVCVFSPCRCVTSCLLPIETGGTSCVSRIHCQRCTLHGVKTLTGMLVCVCCSVLMVGVNGKVKCVVLCSGYQISGSFYSSASFDSSSPVFSLDTSIRSLETMTLSGTHTQLFVFVIVVEVFLTCVCVCVLSRARSAGECVQR